MIVVFECLMGMFHILHKRKTASSASRYMFVPEGPMKMKSSSICDIYGIDNLVLATHCKALLKP